MSGFPKSLLVLMITCVPALTLPRANALNTLAQKNQPTAAQVIESVKQNVGVPWHEPTVDTFKGGDPNTPVTVPLYRVFHP